MFLIAIYPKKNPILRIGKQIYDKKLNKKKINQLNKKEINLSN